MKINFSSEEMKKLKIWAGNSTSGGHWGDGNMILGEESSLLKKINSINDGEVEINSLEIRVLQFWMDDNRKGTDDINSSSFYQTLKRKIETAMQSE